MFRARVLEGDESSSGDDLRRRPERGLKDAVLAPLCSGWRADLAMEG